LLVLDSWPAGWQYPFLAQEWSSFDSEDSSTLQEQPLSFAITFIHLLTIAVAETCHAFRHLHLQIGHALEQAAE